MSAKLIRLQRANYLLFVGDLIAICSITCNTEEAY